VTNRSASASSNLTVCSAIVAQCHGISSLGPNASATVDLPYTAPGTSTVVEGAAMAMSPACGIQRGPRMWLLVHEDPTRAPRDELDVTPGIIGAATLPATRQLTVMFTPAGGTAVDVTQHPETTYHWLGAPDPASRLADALIDQALEMEPLKSLGVTKAAVSVSATGEVQIQGVGINVIRATHKGLASDYTLVLAGVELEGITLEAYSILTGAVDLLSHVKDMLRAETPAGEETNAPLILAPATTSVFLADKGLVTLEDIRFKFLGLNGTLGLKDLLAPFESLITRRIAKAAGGAGSIATMPATLLAGAMKKMLGVVAGTVALQTAGFAGVFELKDEPSGYVTLGGPILRGEVSAVSAGLTTVTGTLDLGGLGKKSDSVLTLVLPGVTKVEIDPQVSRVEVTPPGTATSALPALRAFGEVELVNPLTGKSTFQLDFTTIAGRYRDAAEWMAKMLPKKWKTSLSLDFDGILPLTKFRAGARGRVTLSP
jgi:hypothetical protein